MTMPHNKLNEIILLFLNRNYKVTRIRYKNKFKRVILINGIMHVLTDQASINDVEKKIDKVLRLVFNCDGVVSKKALSNFLPRFLSK
jgi:hypothetical protein